MDERKQRILHAIIQDYIKSAEPVGSRTLAKNYNLGISSATVRNEMSDLEEEGYLEQPHTSAGRIPSAKGYRFYVDSMLHSTGTTREDAEQINRLWHEKPVTFEDFFLDVAKLISQTSHNMSLFLAPAHDMSVLKFVHILPVDTHRAVTVVVTNQGALDNEPLYFKEAVPDDVLTSMALKFGNALKDVRIGELTLTSLKSTIRVIEGPKEVLAVLAEGLYRAVAKRKLFYSVGTTELLEQPEFQDIKRVQPILSLLEQQDQLSTLLGKKEHPEGRGINITIGSENEAEPLKNLSVIQADFTDKKDRIGTLAILGPTRMEYARIIGILSYMQEFIEALAKSKK
ncbi:MAG: heat-inducible transcription repressor HrcA [Veillonella sp.]|nr:heat-inducible transcription repressor HrcA [Veillonella sp.]MBP9624852.1 heat-inducible transcription repressor HrcA [Veillonella sp.]